MAELEVKNCINCNNVLNNSNWSLSSQKKHYYKCSKCVRIKAREWYYENKEKCLKTRKLYYKNNKKKCFKNVAKWRKYNNNRVNVWTANRRAKKLNATPKWLKKLHIKQIQAIYDKAAEFKRLTGLMLEVDHIIPLQGEFVSGLHVPWNLRIMTQSENAKKGNK